LYCISVKRHISPNNWCLLTGKAQQSLPTPSSTRRCRVL